MPLNKDSYANTFLVATVLCLVCAFLVSSAAVVLKPIQAANVQLDRKKNILSVTGFTQADIDEAGGVNELFAKRFDTKIIDLRTGEEAVEECKAAMEKAKDTTIEDIKGSYDQLWASKQKKEEIGLSIPLDKQEDVCGIKRRENFSSLYILKSEDGNKIERYVLPVRGNGLWSLMQGYLAIEPDFQTVAGLTFYQQAETPGLGGEVMNPQWKKKWSGKKIYDGDTVALKVTKGDQSGNEYGVDALSGATITSNGVTNMLEFWMGPKGFGPYIEKQKSGTSIAFLDRAKINSGDIHGQ